MSSPKTLARIAGILYLIMALTGIFAEGVVRSSLVVHGDAAATAENIRASATLFRVGFVTDIVQATTFLLTAMALYLLLAHVNRLVAAAMVTIVAVSAGIQSLNLLNQYVALSMATNEAYRLAFGQAADALAMLFADMQHEGFYIAQMFFGLWLLPLGYLVDRSRYFPRVFGVLLATACFAYLADLFVHFLFPAGEGIVLPIVAVIGAVTELSFMAWLLVKAVKVPETDARLPAMAALQARP